MDLTKLKHFLLITFKDFDYPSKFDKYFLNS